MNSLATIFIASLNFIISDAQTEHNQSMEEEPPFVAFLFNEEVEPDAETWRLTGVQLLPDMRHKDEPLRCFVTLELMELGEVSDVSNLIVEFDTFPIHYKGHLMDAEKVKQVLEDTNCLLK